MWWDISGTVLESGLETPTTCALSTVLFHMGKDKEICLKDKES